jgi:hypothetical protein
MDDKFRACQIKLNRPDVIVRTRNRWYRPKATSTNGVPLPPCRHRGLTGRLRDFSRLDVTFSAAAPPSCRSRSREDQRRHRDCGGHGRAGRLRHHAHYQRMDIGCSPMTSAAPRK